MVVANKHELVHVRKLILSFIKFDAIYRNGRLENECRLLSIYHMTMHLLLNLYSLKLLLSIHSGSYENHVYFPISLNSFVAQRKFFNSRIKNARPAAAAEDFLVFLRKNLRGIGPGQFRDYKADHKVVNH